MIRPRSWSIRSHLFALVLFTVLPLLVLLVQVVVLETREGLQVAERNSRATAETTATSVYRFFHEAELVLGSMATRSAVQALDAEPCRELLTEFLGVLPRFANLFVVDAGGGVVCSALPPPPGGFDPVVDREWFRRAVSERAFQAGSPQVGRISGRWVSVLASPVLDADGELLGVIGGAIDLIGFQTVLEQVSLPAGSVLTIDDLDGVVVARSLDPEGWVGRRLPPSGLSPDILEQPRGSTRVPGAEGVERVWGFTAIEGTPWRVWAGIPVSEVVAPVRQTALRKAILIGLALLAMGGVSLLLYRRVSGSLRNLVEATDRVGSGEDGPIPERGPDEVRKVAAQFNRTLEARSRAETDRRRSLERYRSVLEHAVFGILVTGADDRIREANPALARIVGAPSTEGLRGQPVVALFERPDEVLALRAGLEGGSPVAGVQTTWITREGVPVTVRIHGSMHRDAVGDMAFEWIVEDLTERLILEARIREVQKLEAVGSLAGGVAHDFNNLLTVITTSAHFLREDRSADADIRESADDILDAATRGATLTRQLLTFSRKQVVQPEPLALNRVVEQMEGLLRRLAGDGIQLSVHLDPATGWVEADPAQLEQVLLNLVLNARDASEAHGPVEVRTSRIRLSRQLGTDTGTLPPGEYAELDVADRGSGIPPSIRSRIFEPFFTTKPEGEGTGLGLATVYGIVTGAGGGITVVSRPDEGTTFRILLPRLGDPEES